MVPDRVEREILIDAPPDIVWSVLTEPEHVGRWFSDSAAIDLRPGGELILTWDEHGAVYWRVERVDPPHFVSFRWLRPMQGDAGGVEPLEDNSTLVEFSLGSEGEATRLRVVESGFRELAGSEQENAKDAEEHSARLGARARRAPRLRVGAGARTGTPMRGRDEDVDELWAAVADPTRRRLLDALLAQGDATATTLARELPVTRQAVAKHLAVLDRAGLVEGGRQGREVRYAVRPERLDLAARSLARVASQWDQRLLAIKRIAESAARARARSELDQTTKEVAR